MASKPQELHFLLVPLVSQSHLIPFTEMAKLLAHHGMAVSIVITPLNATRFNGIIDYARSFSLNIQFVSLHFPCQEFGLPEGCENADSLPSKDMAPKFFEACNMLQEPLERWLGELQVQPNCIISDLCLPWTSDISLKFKIPRVVFHTVSCFCLSCSHNIERHRVLERITSDSEPFLVPGIPDRIEFTKPQLPLHTTNTSNNYIRYRLAKFKEAELSAVGALVNTFEELEPRYVEEYRKSVKNIWCIGPLFLSNKVKDETFARKSQCLQWLDSKKPSSVIYVCFGSLASIKPRQLMEIGLGLEASDHSFIWVIRKGDHLAEVDKLLQEDKFEDRVKGRGLIIRGWAPQVSILSHPATGGFLTHCGWNSTLEGVSAGKPMVTWPMDAEQFYNEKLLVQVLKIGVSVGVQVSVPWAEAHNVDSLVKKEDIKRAVEQLMADQGDEAEERRRRAKALGDLSKKAVKEGGSSYLDTTAFIQHIKQLID